MEEFKIESLNDVIAWMQNMGAGVLWPRVVGYVRWLGLGMVVVVALMILVIRRRRARLAFERRHNGLAAGLGGADAQVVVANRAEELERFRLECRGVLYRSFARRGRRALRRRSYFRRARSDMLHLYASCLSALNVERRQPSSPIRESVIELEGELRERRAICRACLGRNRTRVAGGKDPLCELSLYCDAAEPDVTPPPHHQDVAVGIGPNGELILN